MYNNYISAKRIKVIFLILLLLIAGSLLFRISMRNERESFTISDILCLEKDMNIALNKNVKSHPVTVKDVIEMYRADGRSIKYEMTEDALSIKDAWGTPMDVEFTEPSIYKILSYGPNKKDDYGGKDDIYGTFDLSYDNYGVIEQKGF